LHRRTVPRRWFVDVLASMGVGGSRFEQGAFVRSAVVEPVACCGPLALATLSDEQAAATATVLKALADPARVRMMNGPGRHR
jgi:hypothetical protein